MPTIIRPFPSALSSLSMPPLGIVLLRSGRGAVGEVLERREQKFCRTCQQLDAIINWKRCPRMWHVAWGTMVCVLSLSLPLIFCSHLPRVDCHLSLLFRPIDGFQNVF